MLDDLDVGLSRECAGWASAPTRAARRSRGFGRFGIGFRSVARDRHCVSIRDRSAGNSTRACPPCAAVPRELTVARVTPARCQRRHVGVIRTCGGTRSARTRSRTASVARRRFLRSTCASTATLVVCASKRVRPGRAERHLAPEVEPPVDAVGPHEPFRQFGCGRVDPQSWRSSSRARAGAPGRPALRASVSLEILRPTIRGSGPRRAPVRGRASPATGPGPAGARRAGHAQPAATHPVPVEQRRSVRDDSSTPFPAPAARQGQVHWTALNGPYAPVCGRVRWLTALSPPIASQAAWCSAARSRRR